MKLNIGFEAGKIEEFCRKTRKHRRKLLVSNVYENAVPRNIEDASCRHRKVWN